MKKDKILLCVESLDSIKKYEELGISNFLFPLKDYSVGYEDFSLEDIESCECDAYILANRLLTDDDIDEFLKLEFPSNVKGFLIEDTGLYMELKDKGYTLINYQNHLNNNYETVNYWLDRFDSLVISTDITLEEIEKIIDESKKPLVLYTFGYPMIMYSRRHLVTNYYREFDLGDKKEVVIKDPKKTFEFRLKETKYGTSCFANEILDARKEAKKLDDEKILFYLVNAQGIEEDDVLKVILGEEILNTSQGFLYKKTVFRIGDLK